MRVNTSYNIKPLYLKSKLWISSTKQKQKSDLSRNKEGHYDVWWRTYAVVRKNQVLGIYSPNFSMNKVHKKESDLKGVILATKLTKGIKRKEL